ncbi:hypothetical protein NHQ30_001454 [Ciborinia camelliae]|nr:hypothetical protein NHQ30_001454 [Ciborinia camelliae]
MNISAPTHTIDNSKSITDHFENSLQVSSDILAKSKEITSKQQDMAKEDHDSHSQAQNVSPSKGTGVDNQESINTPGGTPVIDLEHKAEQDEHLDSQGSLHSSDGEKNARAERKVHWADLPAGSHEN